MRIYHWLLVISLIGTILLPLNTGTVPVQASSAPSLFGYVWDDIAWSSDTWEDIKCSYGSSGCVAMYNVDQIETIDIGFVFPFFENSYDEVSISKNGFVAFGGLNHSYQDYFPLPLDNTPNNLIAPFWKKLLINGYPGYAGKVFYKMLTTSHPIYSSPRLIIQYNEVTGDATDDPGSLYTFQIILEADGDIYFNYLDMTGDLENAAVGIEDREGLDGLQFSYNSANLANEMSIEFTYPTDDPRYAVKAGPVQQGSILALMQSYFTLTIYNIGSTMDSFELSSTVNGAAWDVDFYDQSGINNLPGNATPLIAPGDSYWIYVRVKVPDPENNPPLVGEFAQVSITAASVSDPSRFVTVQAQTALAAPFALAFSDQPIGMNVQFFTEKWRFTRSIPPLNFGNSLAIDRVSSEIYLTAWQLGRDIEYSLVSFDPLIASTNPPLKFQANPVNTTSFYPTIQATPDGDYLGVLFLKSIYRPSDRRSQQNIFLAILDENGAPVLSNPVAVTNNTGWEKSGDLNISIFSDPFPNLGLAATPDDHFFVTWSEKKNVSGGNTTDIWYAIFNTSGSKTTANTLLTPASTHDGIHYKYPSASRLSDNRVILSYVKDDGGEKVAYRIFNTEGTEMHSEQVISNCSGEIEECSGGPGDSVELSNGNILLSWINGQNKRENVVFTVLDSNGNEVSTPTPLDTPANRTSSSLSITYDGNSHGILTWQDSLRNDYLFYALINGVDGSVLTPPMILRSAKKDGGGVYTNPAGQGNARLTEQLIIQYLFFPFVNREP